MPIYEYKCQCCDDEFEVIQKISDRPLTKCAKCGGRLEKLLSRTSFMLKGGGWYSDGYSRSGSATKTSRAGSKGGTTKGSSSNKGGSD